MTDGSADQQRFIAQELRGELPYRSELDSFGAYIKNDELRDVMIKLSVGWSEYSSDDAPERFEDTPLCRTLMRQYGDRRLLDLLDGENNVGLSFLLGLNDRKRSFDSQFPTLEVLSDIENRGAPYILTIFGDPKKGKTAVASSYVRWSEVLYGQDRLSVLSNIQSFERNDEPFTSFYELDRLIDEYDDIAIVLDEGHEHLEASKTDSRKFVTSEFAPFLKKCGKRGVRLVIIIAHTGRDLHPEIKRLSTHLGRKVDLETFELYADFDDDSHRLHDHVRTLSDLPAPPYWYDPDDMAPFSYEI